MKLINSDPLLRVSETDTIYYPHERQGEIDTH